MFQYIAANDPVGSEAVCNKYGYALQNVGSSDDLAECMTAVVNAEGEQAVVDFANLHPDKELILESFATGGTTAEVAKPGGCGCKGETSVAKQYADAIQGNNNGFSLAGINQGGLFILGSILILGLVIVSNKK